jgi:hypothetical protein
MGSALQLYGKGAGANDGKIRPGRYQREDMANAGFSRATLAFCPTLINHKGSQNRPNFSAIVQQ